MQELGRKYPHAGYGGHFHQWIYEDDPQPYNSCGNGSAMRISPVGFAAWDVEEAKRLAARRLPAYMIPACFIKVDCIPREANGKIAKRKLPTPDRDGGKQ